MFPEFEAARKEAEFAYRFTRLSFALFKAIPATGESFLELLRGRLSYVEHWKRVKEDTRHGLYEFLRYLKSPSHRAESMYDRVADEYDAGLFLWEQFVGRSAIESFESLIRAYVKVGSTVLDAGTGTGETVKSILRLSNPGRVVGLDISRGMLRVARGKIGDSRVRFVKADIDGTPLSRLREFQYCHFRAPPGWLPRRH